MRRMWKLGLTVVLGLGLAGCAWLFTPPQAVLVASPTSGTAPLSVTFSAAGSTGTIVSFTLDFETDGTVDHTGTDITVGVVHTYTAAGTYTATLTVQDNRGRTDTDSVVITVAAPPTTSVSLGAIPASGSAPLDVDFSATITAAPGRRIKHLALDYQTDGTPDYELAVDFATYSGPIASHEYPDPGTYTATLTVTDDASPPQTFTATVTITVTSPPPEITSLSVDGDYSQTVSVTAGNSVMFAFAAEAGTGRKLTKWQLASGDGYEVTVTLTPPVTTLSTSHQYVGGYSQTGSYTARLKVWDDLTPTPHTDEETRTIIVVP